MRTIISLLCSLFLFILVLPPGGYGGTNEQPASRPSGEEPQPIGKTKYSESFHVSEYTKARSLCERMSYMRAKRGGEDVPEDVRKKTRELTDKLAAAKAARWRAYEKGKGKAIPEPDRVVRSLEAEIKEHTAFLRMNYPLYATLRYPGPLDVSQLRLKDDEWAIAYEVTDSGVLVYLIKGHDLLECSFRPIPRAELEKLVRRFVKWNLQDYDDIEHAFMSFDPALGKQLTDLLLGDTLLKLPKSVPVIIVPDDCLSMLPFEMLVLNQGGKVVKDKDMPVVSGLDFFGDDHPISYCPSLTWLTHERILRAESKTGDRILVIADPVFSPRDPRVPRPPDSPVDGIMGTVPGVLMSIRNQIGLEFARLHMTGELARHIAQAHPNRTDVLTGLDASKNRLLKTPLERYGTIVIATCGYYGKDLPGIREPVLVLSRVDLPAQEDGFLRASEMMRLPLNADLVVLLANETGTGKIHPGEGVMSMGRAVLHAGGRAVLVSLLPVVESTAVKLAESFFKHMAAGVGKRESLTGVFPTGVFLCVNHLI
jgi:hypothetical protein